MIEKKREDLKVGDVLIAKQGGTRYTITGIVPGPGGSVFPYLTLKDGGGKEREHDTMWDRPAATYMVETTE